MKAMERVMITIPKDLIHGIDMLTDNRSEFIRKSVKERLKRERHQMLVEGYKKEKNLEEWETTAGDGIE